MATGTELFNELDQRSKNINNALDDMNAVIIGSTNIGATSIHNTVWPTTDVPNVLDHVDAIQAAFAGLTVTDNLEDAIDTLFEGLPVGDSILKASEEITKFMQKINDETQKLLNTANLGDRVQAFKDLVNEQDDNDLTTAPYGYVPAILDVFNAAANTNLNTKPVTDAIETVEGALTSVESYRVFAEYVAQSTALLIKSLAVGQKGVGDR